MARLENVGPANVIPFKTKRNWSNILAYANTLLIIGLYVLVLRMK